VPVPFIKGVQLSGTITRKLDLQFSVDFNEPPSATNPARGVIIAEALAPFQITSVELANGQLLIAWTGGKPPYQIQSSSNFATWQNFGAPTSGLTATLPASGSGRLFFRIAGQ
jgi:hypothetical protein